MAKHTQPMEHKVAIESRPEAIVTAIRHIVVDADTAHMIVSALAGKYAEHLRVQDYEDRGVLELLDNAADALGDEIDFQRAAAYHAKADAIWGAA